jgi:hypothetical protein
LSSKGWELYHDVKKCRWDSKKQGWNYAKLEKPACGVAVRKKCFGSGAERIVFQFSEIYKESGSFYLLPTEHTLVAKVNAVKRLGVLVEGVAFNKSS